LGLNFKLVRLYTFFFIFYFFFNFNLIGSFWWIDKNKKIKKKGGKIKK
jgi:hypothetical protein